MIQIKDKSQCCGCMACESVCTHKAIIMQPDEEGFLYPSVNSSLCINCGLCDAVCPIIYRNKNVDLSHNPKALYAVRHKDKETLLDSSSGGAFFCIGRTCDK